jgi:Na+/melibiose symporter-like transporter
LLLSGKVYTLTKDPLSLGIIGLMEIIPALSMALFAGHIVDQREKRNLFLCCIGLFSLISLGLFFLSRLPLWPVGIKNQFSTQSMGLFFLGAYYAPFLGLPFFL